MVQTDSIVKMLEVLFNKNIKSISEIEFKTIKKISIEKISYDGSFLNVNYSDLLLFENLEELNIYNCMINQECIDIILQLKKINKLYIYSCDFIDGTFNIFDKKYKALYLIDCLGLHHSIINNADEVLLNNTKIMGVNNVQVLTTDNVKDMKMEKIDTLIIKNVIFEESLISNNEVKKISIIDDRNEIIKEYTKWLQ